MSDTITPTTQAGSANLPLAGNTQYVILAEYRDSESWREHARASGSSAEAAIRAAVDTEGTYIAVPLRSWKPISVRTETTTRIVIETAD